MKISTARSGCVGHRVTDRFIELVLFVDRENGEEERIYVPLYLMHGQQLTQMRGVIDKAIERHYEPLRAWLAGNRPDHADGCPSFYFWGIGR
jgi:hypothetical protein